MFTAYSSLARVLFMYASKKVKRLQETLRFSVRPSQHYNNRDLLVSPGQIVFNYGLMMSTNQTCNKIIKMEEKKNYITKTNLYPSSFIIVILKSTSLQIKTQNPESLDFVLENVRP